MAADAPSIKLNGELGGPFDRFAEIDRHGRDDWRRLRTRPGSIKASEPLQARFFQVRRIDAVVDVIKGIHIAPAGTDRDPNERLVLGDVECVHLDFLEPDFFVAAALLTTVFGLDFLAVLCLRKCLNIT